jgi:cell division protein ZapA (FtsZ GTPase activity inhibitor)
MTEPERLVRFHLLGQEYKFYTAAGEEEMDAILSLVRELVENDPVASRGTLAAGKVAIMACLNIASRYVRLQREHERYREAVENRFERLSRKIEEGLGSE